MGGEGEGKVVCVTGASGYVASWLVKLLLERGDPGKTKHLEALEGGKERLELFEADLMEEGSFDSVIDGCDGVFHTASPVNFSSTNPQQWYCLSKTLAEEASWKFAQENGIDLVVMNPGLVIGPLLQPTLNTTSQFQLDIIKGKPLLPYYQFVDVRDVAYAHVMGFEKYSASGSGGDDDGIGEVSTTKSESLGVSFMDVEVSLKDSIESLKEKNFLDF
ncbi:hypothetical protein C2S51_016716 [Perilla frutescens var. frutescens]|nr:hypothetical protein C2S51_016716 [Perilla frutescens var. frutescens]